ncbi:flagellar biosynthetic protein FliO [Nitrosomonas oligotropha]|uniref:Flagellar protein n=1 Tax=Nitrosomonas oligotropha TaxID=42354 RepID=A0A1H8L2C5_9PROT|nr:flagellar biosynthetic protein FliO [Nitrosomonas oligotropha]SDW17363.1 flagellar protein FliO/FliZ [Nitrosomonas oligotropha]SEN98798.1 flagellar protein FliO/FliZ [Nitrosomonas oligotropha]
MLTRYGMFLLLTLSFSAVAETGKPSYVPPSPVISTESTVQMIGALLLVLAVIVGGTWLLKRFSLIPAAASGVVKVVAAAGVGQRERVVVVEIDQTWLVLGVAPGRVNKLHTMTKPGSDAPGTKPDHHPVETFATQLNQSMEKENA